MVHLYIASGCMRGTPAVSDVHLMSDCHFLTSSLGSGGFTNRPWMFCTTVFFSPNMVYWSIDLIKLGRYLFAHHICEGLRSCWRCPQCTAGTKPAQTQDRSLLQHEQTEELNGQHRNRLGPSLGTNLCSKPSPLSLQA